MAGSRGCHKTTFLDFPFPPCCWNSTLDFFLEFSVMAMPSSLLVLMTSTPANLTCFFVPFLFLLLQVNEPLIPLESLTSNCLLDEPYLETSMEDCDTETSPLGFLILRRSFLTV
ncbi:Zinc finger protein [Gossypium arboreum]|uniref:Zinc finger protein n=1 Tax=Gossypium arboreum TaxID=29729 RepID=A0A0B0NGH8_GOSAR|nr:Zinc finger protein [Gossypium arboreum]